jgi:hypothetical protein
MPARLGVDRSDGPVLRTHAPLGVADGRLRAFGLICVSVVTILVASGTVSASAIGPVALAPHDAWSAPYRTSSTASDLSDTPSGCGNHLAVAQFPEFNPKTGELSQSVRAWTHSCGTHDSSHTVSSGIGVAGPEFSARRSGTYNLTAKLNLSFKVNLIASPGNATQMANASFEIFTLLILDDFTSDSAWAGNSSLAISQYVTSGGYAHEYTNLRVHDWLDASLVAGDTLLWEFELYVTQNTWVTPGSAFASSTLSLDNPSSETVLGGVFLT